MLDKIHIYISIFAAMVISVVCIVFKVSLVEMVSRLILTISVFYIIGLITEDYVKQKIFPQKQTNEDQTESDITDVEELDDMQNDMNHNINEYDDIDAVMQEDDYE